jgi:hypothetical protein
MSENQSNINATSSAMLSIDIDKIFDALLRLPTILQTNLIGSMMLIVLVAFAVVALALCVALKSKS